MADEDLKYVLRVDPDLTAVNAALKATARHVDDLSTKATFGLGSKVGNIAGGVGVAAAGGLSLANRGLHGLQGNLGPIGVGLDAAQAGLGGAAKLSSLIPVIGQVAGPLLTVAASAVPIIKDTLGAVASFAGVASPGLMRSWQMALDDVQGVIGQSVVPGLVLMRDTVRGFGDLLANIMPTTEEVAEALVPLRQGLHELRDALRELSPFLKDAVLVGINLFVTHLRLLVLQMKWAAQAVSQVLGFIGLNVGQVGNKSSFGAATQQAHFSGFEEYQKQLQQQAYSEPGATMASLPGTVINIQTILTDMLAKMGEWSGEQLARLIGGEFARALAEAAGNQVGEAAVQAAQASGQAAGKVVNVAGGATAWLFGGNQ